MARHAVLRLAVHQQRHAARRRRELHKHAGVVVQVPLEEVAGRLLIKKKTNDGAAEESMSAETAGRLGHLDECWVVAYSQLEV